MCRKIVCACGKVSWAGCGQHVAGVLAGVADDAKCAALAAGKPALAPASSRDPCPAAAAEAAPAPAPAASAAAPAGAK